MKTILVLGAGRSAPYLIRYLLDRGEEGGWSVTVCDRSLDAATALVDGHPQGQALALDVTDPGELGSRIEASQVVVNLLPPAFQLQVARACLDRGRPMVSASYQDSKICALQREAKRWGVPLLTEMGLDPGIDLMSAVELIRRVEERGGVVETFESYGSGVPAPESSVNPLRYAVTWNPRNVVMAAEGGALYLHQGRVRIVPWHRIFEETWPVDVEGVGTLEAYPNRNSLSYRDSFGLAGAQTLIRGTLRYPGWSETWRQVVRLGLPNESFEIPGLGEMSWRDLVETFLPPGLDGSGLEDRVARLLGINPTGRVMETLRWLGLFSAEPVGGEVKTAAQALVHLLGRKLTLTPEGRDMIVLLHDLGVRYPDEGDRRERITTTLVEKGTPGGMTAMARLVGLPAAITARLLATGRLDVSGCPLPTDARIYRPLLRELAAEGVAFGEQVTALNDGPKRRLGVAAG